MYEAFQAIFTSWTPAQWLAISVIFIWSGFVRTGLGFGGAALALPFMLMLKPEPVFWLPIVGTHLLVFSSITVYRRLGRVDWLYLRQSIGVMIIPKLLGVFGLISLSGSVLTVIVYSITLFYALTYVFNYTIKSQSKWLDNLLLIVGGYVSGTSLIGAPLIVSVYMRHVELSRLRDTLFVLWIILVIIKMTTFVLLAVPLQWHYSLLLLPVVTIGHLLGLRAHQKLVSAQGNRFKQVLGAGLVVICLLGIIKLVGF